MRTSFRVFVGRAVSVLLVRRNFLLDGFLSHYFFFLPRATFRLDQAFGYLTPFFFDIALARAFCDGVSLAITYRQTLSTYNDQLSYMTMG
jgi:hypothetical protein